MNEPEYYCKNGLSPLKAFQKGLLSRDEYAGFIKGNIIKYVVRCEDKSEPTQDVLKAMEYLRELYYLVGSEECGLSVDGFRDLKKLIGDEL